MELIKNKKTLSTQELLDRLKAENWEKLIKQLHYYSLNRLKKFPQVGERFNIVNLSNHFADEAIRQIWTEERIWDVEQYPSLYDFLKGAIDSIRSNFLKSKEVITTTFIDEVIENSAKDSTSDPQALLEAKELEEMVMQIFSSDPEAFQVFDCLKNELPPREISIELNIPINQVYNAVKRIERKLTELRKNITQ
ncbi:hypothetical protein [Mucilaginibacter sp.]|uniref:hypothetical protein n=1 Tax=Mucilaginibacter sp. TaxID=1882438 RepID=UPI0025E00EBF|nr:hypothetical protein [Mucilaginibacter sp.]